MTRSVQFSLFLPAGNTFIIEMCDKYLYPLGEKSVVASVGVPVALEINEGETCWVATLPTKQKKAFWVYENNGASEAVQNIDLDKPVYRRSILPSLEHTSIEVASVNVADIIDNLTCGFPLISKEEQRLICRYGDFASGNDDSFLCNIDNSIGGV